MAPRDTGSHTPPSSANTAVTPPIAGPIASAVSKWPSRIPIAANGASATSIRRVICSPAAAPPDDSPERIGCEQVAEQNPDRGERCEPDEHQERHLQPVARPQVDAH